MARREILGIVGLLGLMMNKADCGEGSARPAARRRILPISETPFYFNELNDYVNEKIRMPNDAPREQLCPKPAESSMDLLLAQGMSRDSVGAVRYRGRSWTAL
jgi:hypothetical protein